MQIKLEDHIPVPEGRAKSSVVRAAMNQMNVGQSFVTKSPSQVHVYKKNLRPKDFITRPEGKAFRCWRSA